MPCESMVTCLNPVAPDRSSCTVLGPKLPPWATWDMGSDLNGRSCVCIDNLGSRWAGSIGSTATFTLISPWQIFAGRKQNIKSSKTKRSPTSQKIEHQTTFKLIIRHIKKGTKKFQQLLYLRNFQHRHLATRGIRGIRRPNPSSLHGIADHVLRVPLALRRGQRDASPLVDLDGDVTGWGGGSP